MTRRAGLAGLLVAVVLVLAGCHGASPRATTAGTTTTTTAVTTTAGGRWAQAGSGPRWCTGW